MVSFHIATRISDTISLCASVSCCSVLVLMLVKPPKSIGNYRYCYYILSSFECFSAISHFFGAPAFYVNGDTYLAFSTHGSLIAHVCWIFAFHAYELWLLSCFIYRYATVCRNQYILDVLSTKQSSAVVFTATELLNNSFESFDSKFTKISNGLVGFDYDIGPVFVSSTCVQILCVIGNVITVSTLVTIVSCALLIFNYIKVNAFSAIQTRQHYRVLLYLSLQAFVPFCLVYSLALVCQVVILIRIDISTLAPILTITTSIPPLVGAISVISLTNEYRKMFAKGIGLRTVEAKTSSKTSTKTSTTVSRNAIELTTVSRASRQI